MTNRETKFMEWEKKAWQAVMEKARQAGNKAEQKNAAIKIAELDRLIKGV